MPRPISMASDGPDASRPRRRRALPSWLATIAKRRQEVRRGRDSLVTIIFWLIVMVAGSFLMIRLAPFLGEAFRNMFGRTFP